MPTDAIRFRSPPRHGQARFAPSVLDALLPTAWTISSARRAPVTLGSGTQSSVTAGRAGLRQQATFSSGWRWVLIPPLADEATTNNAPCGFVCLFDAVSNVEVASLASAQGNGVWTLGLSMVSGAVTVKTRGVSGTNYTLTGPTMTVGDLVCAVVCWVPGIGATLHVNGQDYGSVASSEGGRFRPASVLNDCLGTNATSYLTAAFDGRLVARRQELSIEPDLIFVRPPVVVPASAGGGDATLAGATLTATASLLGGALQASSTLSGTTLTATASLIPGQLQATATLAGATLTATASIVPGALQAGSTIAGQTLTATASLIPGVLTGQGDATLAGQTLTATASLLPGTLTSTGNTVTLNGTTLTATASLISGVFAYGSTMAGQTLTATASLLPGVLFDASAGGSGARRSKMHLRIGVGI